QQALEVDGVVRGVVDPPVAEHGVLHLADQPVRSALQRGAAVGQGHLDDDGFGGPLRGVAPPTRDVGPEGIAFDEEDDGLDADLARRVVEAPRAQPAQPRSPAPGVPPLAHDPLLDELPLRRGEPGVEDLGHQDLRSRCTVTMCTGSASAPSRTKFARPHSHCWPVTRSVTAKRSSWSIPSAPMSRRSVDSRVPCGSTLATTMTRSSVPSARVAALL